MPRNVYTILQLLPTGLLLLLFSTFTTIFYCTVTATTTATITTAATTNFSELPTVNGIPTALFHHAQHRFFFLIYPIFPLMLFFLSMPFCQEISQGRRREFDQLGEGSGTDDLLLLGTLPSEIHTSFWKTPCMLLSGLF